MMNTNRLKEILLSQPNKKTTTYAKGTPIMMQGEESMEMFYIVSGKVRTVLTNKNGEEFIISTHGTGECICESSYVLQASGILSIYAEEETTLLEINKESYYEIVRDNPEFSFHIIRSIASIALVLAIIMMLSLVACGTSANWAMPITAVYISGFARSGRST